MPINTWPSTLPAPDIGLEEENYLPITRTEFENGTVQRRRRATKEKLRWPNLAISSLTEAQAATLAAFFKANQGLSFNWTHPTTGVAYVCSFSGNSLKFTLLDSGYRSAEIPIEEA